MTEDLKGRIEDCTIGPVPVHGVVAILHQLREQGWKPSFVAFSGMISMQEKLSLARPVPLPSYLIVAEKYFEDGVELTPPKINQGA